MITTTYLSHTITFHELRNEWEIITEDFTYASLDLTRVKRYFDNNKEAAKFERHEAFYLVGNRHLLKVKVISLNNWGGAWIKTPNKDQAELSKSAFESLYPTSKQNIDLFIEYQDLEAQKAELEKQKTALYDQQQALIGKLTR